jgi:hypothetical protein
MNDQSAPLFPKYTLWLTIAGFLLGLLAATYISVSQKHEFESITVFRPVRPAGEESGVPHREWLNTEAAALASQENLLRVAKNFNLESEWNRSEAECVQALKNMVRVESMSDSSLIRVLARSSKSSESASIVNEVVAARGKFYQEKHGSDEERQRAARSAARVDEVELSCLRRRRAFLDGLEAAKLLPDYTTDAGLKELTLPEPLEKLRSEWIAETARIQEAKKLSEALYAQSRVPPYAEILEQGTPSMNPVDTGIQARMSRWAGMGAGAGLLLSYVLGRFTGRTPGASPPQKPGPVPPVEY